MGAKLAEEGKPEVLLLCLCSSRCGTCALDAAEEQHGDDRKNILTALGQTSGVQMTQHEAQQWR